MQTSDMRSAAVCLSNSDARDSWSTILQTSFKRRDSHPCRERLSQICLPFHRDTERSNTRKLSNHSHHSHALVWLVYLCHFSVARNHPCVPLVISCLKVSFADKCNEHWKPQMENGRSVRSAHIFFI